MKALLPITLVALLGAAAAGCSSSRTASSSVEYDDMYHSASDRTATASTSSADYSSSTLPSQNADAANSADAVANPEYSSGTANADQQGSTYITNNNYDYYYAGHSSRRYRSFVNRSYYADPYYTPAWAVTPYYGGLGMGYGYYSPYSPYVDPFWYTPMYGPTVSISIGYGYGYNPYYSPFYSPWGSYCSPYAWGGPYGCGYPYAGWRNPYYDGYWHGYNDGLYGNYIQRTPVAYGRRDDRGSVTGRGNYGKGRPANEGGRLQSSGRPRNPNSAVATPSPRPAAAAEGTISTPQRPAGRPAADNAVQSRPSAIDASPRPRGNTPVNSQPSAPRPRAADEAPDRPAAQPAGRPQTTPELPNQPRGNSVSPENAEPATRPTRPVSGDIITPTTPESAPRPRSGNENEVVVPEQQARPRGLFNGTRGNRTETQPAPSQHKAPAREYSTPSRSNDRGGSNSGGYNTGGSRPSAPAGGGGRPR